MTTPKVYDPTVQQEGPARRSVFLREVTVRYSGPRRAAFSIRKASDIKNFALSILKDDAREHFIAVFLDCAHQVISYSIVSIGTANSTQVHPREVFQHAILAGAGAIVVAHNHPSGHLEPSDADHAVTRCLVEAGELLGIKVLDHVIFSRNDFVSFSENGWLKR